MTDAKRCPECGEPMRVEVAGRIVGSRDAHVGILWFCESCDYAAVELRPA